MIATKEKVERGQKSRCKTLDACPETDLDWKGMASCLLLYLARQFRALVVVHFGCKNGKFQPRAIA